MSKQTPPVKYIVIENLEDFDGYSVERFSDEKKLEEWLQRNWKRAGIEIYKVECEMKPIISLGENCKETK